MYVCVCGVCVYTHMYTPSVPISLSNLGEFNLDAQSLQFKNLNFPNIPLNSNSTCHSNSRDDDKKKLSNSKDTELFVKL